MKIDVVSGVLALLFLPAVGEQLVGMHGQMLGADLSPTGCQVDESERRTPTFPYSVLMSCPPN
jgi:hypothetical protein